MNEKMLLPVAGDRAVPASKVRLWLDVASIFLFVLSLLGIWLIVNDGDVNRTDWSFYLTLALVVVSLLLFAAVLSFQARMEEKSRLETLYQNRIDLLQGKLNTHETMLRLVSGYQAGGITIFDRHNRYWFVNKRAAETLGMAPDEIVGRPPIKILSGERLEKLETHLTKVRSLDIPLEFVDGVTDKEGRTRFIQFHYEQISDSSEMNGCILLREDDFTSLFVERERRERMLRQVIDTLVAVVDRRDPYASGHSLRVGQLAGVLAQELELDPILKEASEIAGSLMNFGKVLVPRHILTKTSSLTPEELQRVRDSILTSADILAIIGFEGPVVPTLRQVLERYDGSGGPDGLKGEEIMITARIVAVANAFVAFVSPRAHRPGLPFGEALAVIANDSGKAFDERILLTLTDYIENQPNKLDWLSVSKQESV